MRRPWMPLYIADYLADTAHLSIAESGVYLHLIMHYWLKDGLPDDDAQLARIVKLSHPEWCSIRPTIAALFGPDWSHARIDHEIAEADAAYERRSTAGKKSGQVRRASAFNNDRTMFKQPHPQPQSDGGGDGQARAKPSAVVSREAVSVADELLVIAGHDPKFVPPAWCGAAMRVQAWMAADARWTREVMIAGAKAAMARKTDGAPSTVNYFEKPIARLISQQSAPIQKVEVRVHEQTSQHRPATGWQQSRDRFREAHAALKEHNRSDEPTGEGSEAGDGEDARPVAALGRE